MTRKSRARPPETTKAYIRKDHKKGHFVIELDSGGNDDTAQLLFDLYSAISSVDDDPGDRIEFSIGGSDISPNHCHLLTIVARPVKTVPRRKSSMGYRFI